MALQHSAVSVRCCVVHNLPSAVVLCCYVLMLTAAMFCSKLVPAFRFLEWSNTYAQGQLPIHYGNAPKTSENTTKTDALYPFPDRSHTILPLSIWSSPHIPSPVPFFFFFPSSLNISCCQKNSACQWFHISCNRLHRSVRMLSHASEWWHTAWKPVFLPAEPSQSKMWFWVLFKGLPGNW